MAPSPAGAAPGSHSEQFPNWQGDFLVGSLKSRSLFRVDIENIGRIRDIEQGYNGELYLLFEHSAGGQIVKLIPNKR